MTRVRLELTENQRNPALLNMTVDSKNRDFVPICVIVVEVFAVGGIKEGMSVVECKTSEPVQFEISERIENWQANYSGLFGIAIIVANGAKCPAIYDWRICGQSRHSVLT